MTDNICQIAYKKSFNALQYLPEEFRKKVKNSAKRMVIPQDKYQEIFSEIRSHFPEKLLSFKL